MGMDQLVDQYLDQIEVEDANYIPVDGAISDVAYLLLNLPTKMLDEYLRLKGQDKELPDCVEFWKETGLREKLRALGRFPGRVHEPLGDILDFLGGDICAYFYDPGTSDRIRMDITETPQYHDTRFE